MQCFGREPTTTFTNRCLEKSQVKDIGQYLLTKFGRVNCNDEKVTYKVTIPQTSNFLAKNLRLEAWVEHIGQRINSGHYYMIRRNGEVLIKMSDDVFTIYNSNFIGESKLCYIALLKSL